LLGRKLITRMVVNWLLVIRGRTAGHIVVLSFIATVATTSFLYLFEEFPDKTTGTAGDYDNNNESDNTKRTASSTVVIVVIVLSWRDQGLLIRSGYSCNISTKGSSNFIWTGFIWI